MREPPLKVNRNMRKHWSPLGIQDLYLHPKLLRDTKKFCLERRTESYRWLNVKLPIGNRLRPQMS